MICQRQQRYLKRSIMRIKSVEIAWFRGAADLISLELDSKSIVVYGENGSGKSTFIDAIEYLVNDGRIEHLAHEYSGRHQENAIINTHTPKGKDTEINIIFHDGSNAKVSIKENGSFSRIEEGTEDIKTWDYRQTILRQDEVAMFIHHSKGEKYSTLLPLLGLDKLEFTAENLRQLAKSVKSQTKLNDIETSLAQIEVERKSIFGEESDENIIIESIDALHSTYCGDNATAEDVLTRCEQISTELKNRVAQFTVQQNKHVILQNISELDFSSSIDAIRRANSVVTGEVKPLIAEIVGILNKAQDYMDKQEDTGNIDCPACGRSISVEDFQSHVASELDNYKEINATLKKRNASRGLLCDEINLLITLLNKKEIKSWYSSMTEGEYTENLTYLDEIDVEVLRSDCKEEDLKDIESNLIPLKSRAAADSSAPPDVKQLLNDKKTIEVATNVIKSKGKMQTMRIAQALISYLNSVEIEFRNEINEQASKVIGDISSDIEAMWHILHPDNTIEGVHLYIPDSTDKAIDIGLKFHGIDQSSPKLTLSEGYRNSLGLCIFLAMVLHKPENDRPLFLDDVVISLDRNHRGMIVEVLNKMFDGQQVVILTHDRDWYTDLRFQLNKKNWNFKVLLPYKEPIIGIRWSNKESTFDDARAQLENSPDSAGNTARKIMDIEFSIIASRIRIRMDYLRGDRNDKRMAHEFIERIVSDGDKSFQRKSNGAYEIHSDAIEALKTLDGLLLSWGNRASHTFDIVLSEATKLIDLCEKVLEYFKCNSCNKDIGFTVLSNSKGVQCECGHLRWRY